MSIDRSIKAIFCMIFIPVFIVVSLSGCKVKHPVDTSSLKENKPVEMKIVLGYAEEIPSEQNLVIQELNKLANANIIIEWTPMVSYNDKFNVLMASNSMPDVVLVPDVKNSTFLYAANAECSGN